ncbi:hypothetical protein DSL72_003615 [Monilinia vaccinii-corymbosi]|uniref:Cell wall protein n=1 Tax=Monilinia vaccinii-corymbosi TaxID=61207 RepID=A0A8A3NTT3_9HELO|nr:hypothetical protein DSL72_003615 [Monilinia vaccinii-corymbosi]
MYTNLWTVASLCVVVLAHPGQQSDRRQDVSAISASLASLSSALVINPSIAAELTCIPSSVQALQSNAAGISQLASEFINSGVPGWYSSLSPAAQSYVLGDGAARASLLQDASSLESLLGGATATPAATAAATITATPASVITGVINGTAATLAPVGTGVLTLASSTSGGNSTVTTRKLSSATTATATEAETETETETAGGSAGGKTSEPSPISSSSTGGAAQVTGVVGLGVAGLVGLVWVL